MATHTGRRLRSRSVRRTRTRARTRRPWHASSRRSEAAGGLSRLIWLLALGIALVLLVGIAMTWAGADAAHEPVYAVMRAGSWLATPFRDVFTNPDARVRLTGNWLLATGFYLLTGRILAWLLR
jgi:hypothetical protein